jgi:hypothetical protein
MKLKYTFVVLSLFLFLQSYGQFNYTDVVYLKNGSIIRGVIIEQIPNQSLKIKTFDKSIFVFKYDEVDKITKEENESKQSVAKLKSPKKVNSDTNRLTTKGKFFINFNLGLSGNAASQVIDNSYSYDGSYGESSNVVGSLGKGVLANLRMGYQISNAIALDLGMSYLIGSKITSNNVSTSSNSQSELNASIFNLNPAISISHAQNSLGFYVRSGILIGIAPKFENDYTANYTSGLYGYYNKVRKTEFTGGVPFGFSNSLGITFSLSPSICIVSELNLYTQTWAPEKSVITEYKLDGEDKLYTLTDKETIYTNSLNSSSSNNSDLKFYMPLSSISFNLGLKVNL